MNINEGVLNGVRRVGARFRSVAVDGGISGAPLGLRIMGATTSGPPTTGTWKAGDTAEDRNGAIWVCTTGGTPGTWTLPGLTAGTAGAAQPNDLGYLGWTFDPAVMTGTGTSTPLGSSGTAGAGVLQLIKIPLNGQSVATTGVRMLFVTVGSSLTSSENFAFLYNSSGTFLAATADQTTPWTTSGNAGKTLDMPWASVTTVSGAFCWVALVYNGTTGPAFSRTSNITAAWANGKLAAANSRYGSILSSVTSSTPGNFTPSSITQLAVEFWAALY